MKGLLKVFIMILFHLVVFVIIHEIGIRIAQLIFETSKGGISWGVTVRYAVVVFSIIVTALSILREYSNSLKLTRIGVVLSCLGFICLFITNIKYAPFKTLLLLVSGILGIIIPVLLKHWAKNKW